MRHIWQKAFLFVAASGALSPAYGSDVVASGDSNTGHIFGYIKAMYVADDKKGGRPNQSTPGFGGKLGGETSEYAGFKLKGAWYVTTDLGLRHEDPRKTDAYMFDLDKTPYSLLGEMQLSGKLGKTELIFGRQEFLSPIINTYEYRIIPNLFEAYTLINRDIPETTLTLAYVAKMSGLDGLVTFSEFRSMSQQTYTSLQVAPDGSLDNQGGETVDISKIVGHRGVLATGIEFGKNPQLRLWNYFSADTLNTVYFDARLKARLNQDFSSTIEGQAYRVFALGGFRDYLAQRGLNASYGLLGVKGTLAHQPSGISIGLALNHFTGNKNTVTAFGNWGGYPEFVTMPYLYAESKGASAIVGSYLSRATILFDLGVFGFSEQSVLLGHAHINIDESIQSDSDIKVNTLLYRAQISSKLSARVAIDARHSKNLRYDNEFIALALRYDF
ncbi:MAG: hypothetical protein PHV02_04895 [Rhodocyclaceae bacterium]|nr:hypothetical protein [Rhodocyclaceae bacterium]